MRSNTIKRDDDGGTLATISEFARALGVSRLNVRRKILSGEIHALKIFDRWRVPISEIERLVARAKTSGPSGRTEP
jgi:excisionase family DNA binding protein